jgi:deazaflavin-dependent oxidoreductase (nitroreductase family)
MIPSQFSLSGMSRQQRRFEVNSHGEQGSLMTAQKQSNYRPSEHIPGGESTTVVRAWNDEIIGEFRSNDGMVGGMFADLGTPLLLLTSTGRKSGNQVMTPLATFVVGERIVVTGSNFGRDKHPNWYYNVKNNPEITVEMGTTVHTARAVILEGEERDRLFEGVVKLMPGQGDYQKATSRTIPVVEIILTSAS